MTATLDAANAPAAGAFGHRLAPIGDPLEGAGFDDIYTAKIEPELVKCEAERRGAMKTFALALAAGGLVLFLEFSLARVPWLMVITGVLTVFIAYLPLAAVAKKAKVSVIQSLCEPLGVSYSPDGKAAPAWDSFLNLRLLPHPDEKTFSDFFSGKRGDADFQLCEATLTQGSGKNRRTVFTGQLFCLSAPRRLASTTVCLRNTGWFKSFECPSGLKPVGLEDPNFNKTFAVFGTDQVEAREILTPTFMQQLNDLEAAYFGGHIRCAFDETQLLIALEGANKFEIGSMFTSLVDRSRVEGIARNIEQVFKMIDEFRGA
jgi:hypothetical protein